MNKRKRVSIQLTREEIDQLRSRLQEPEDLRLIMRLRMARERFGARLVATSGCAPRTRSSEAPNQMDDEITNVVDLPSRPRAWRRYPKIAELQPGQALLVTWASIGNRVADPDHSIRSIAFYWSKARDWRKWRTMKHERGIYIIRDA